MSHTHTSLHQANIVKFSQNYTITLRILQNRHLCEPARQPDLLQCYALVEDSVSTDDLHCQLLWNVEFDSQQLLHVTDARTNRTPNKLGLQRRKLIVVKHISRQTTKSTVYTIMAVNDNRLVDWS